MPIIRRVVRAAPRGIVGLPDRLVRDANLPLGAVGLMAYLLSNPDGVTFTVDDMERIWCVGPDAPSKAAIRRYFALLERCGYLIRVRDSETHRTVWWVTDAPVDWDNADKAVEVWSAEG